VAAKSFLPDPRPSPETIQILERALNAARRGYVQAVVVVAVTPVHEAQVLLGGDLSEIRANSLLGGLTRAAAEILKLL